MPTYDYKCLECGDDFEVFQQMSDDFLNECPKCKGKVKRLIGSGVGVIFKGSGFYETDYKKKSAPISKNEKVPEKCKGCEKSGCSQVSDN